MTEQGSSGRIVCQGCGGRNVPAATECDWCGKLFVSPARRLRLTAWHVASTVLLIVLLAAVTTLGVLNSGRTLPSVALRQDAPTPAAGSSSTPTPAVTPRVVAAMSPTPRPTPTELPGASPPTPAPTPTPVDRRIAIIANTGGTGVSIREAPGPQARLVGSAREGTTMELTGAEQSVAARLWREVEDPARGVRGWVAAEFLDLAP